MAAAAPPASHPSRLPSQLIRLLLQRLTPLRQTAAAGAAKVAAAASEQSSVTRGQLIAHKNEDFMRQISERNARAAALQNKQRAQ